MERHRQQCIANDCYNNFHACGSCGYMEDWEYSYCSFQCYRKENETKMLEVLQEYKLDLKTWIELDLDMEDYKELARGISDD